MKSDNIKVRHGNKIVKVAIELVLTLFCLFFKKTRVWYLLQYFSSKKLTKMFFNLGCTAGRRLKKKKRNTQIRKIGGYTWQICLRIEIGSKIVSWQFSSVCKFSNNAWLPLKIILVIQPQKTQDPAAILLFLFFFDQHTSSLDACIKHEWI